MSCERFFIISTFSKAIEKSQIAFLEKFLTNENFSFLLISCTRNRHSTVIESYIRRNDVIRCELDLAFTEKTDSLFDFTDDCRMLPRRREEKRDVDRLSQIVVTKHLINFHRLLSRDVFAERVAIRFLERRETEQICL
jgi:light-regulated signal transduction histidine kinase (bacteriophytochrome)